MPRVNYYPRGVRLHENVNKTFKSVHVHLQESAAYMKVLIKILTEAKGELKKNCLQVELSAYECPLAESYL